MVGVAVTVAVGVAVAVGIDVAVVVEVAVEVNVAVGVAVGAVRVTTFGWVVGDPWMAVFPSKAEAEAFADANHQFDRRPVVEHRMLVVKSWPAVTHQWEVLEDKLDEASAEIAGLKEQIAVYSALLADFEEA